MSRTPVVLPILLALLLPGTAVAVSPAGVERSVDLREEPLEEDASALRSRAEDRQSLGLVIYQQGPALVEDRRGLGLPEGVGVVLVEDLLPALLPESLRLQAGDGVRTLGHRYIRSRLDSAGLVDAFVGETVTAVREGRDGVEHERRVRLLARDGEVLIVRGEDGVEVIRPGSGWRLRLPEVPAALRAPDTLRIEVESDRAGRREASLLYLTEGLAWQADYVLLIDEDRLSVEALASVENRSGRTLADAHLRLVAGDPGRAHGPEHRTLALREDAVTDEPAGDYRLYRLEQPVTLEDGERNHLPLFRVDDLPLEREYRLTGHAWGQQRGGEQAYPVTVRLHLDAGANGLDRALPAGLARVYQVGADGGTLFLGEDRLAPTAAGGRVELSLGTAFDLSATRQQTHFRRLDDRSEEQGWRIRVRNTREQDSRIRIIEEMPGNWTLLEASTDPTVSERGRAIWLLDVPAGGEVELRYRAEVRR